MGNIITNCCLYKENKENKENNNSMISEDIVINVIRHLKIKKEYHNHINCCVQD